MRAKKPCSHGSILPRGLQCVRGYLTIKIATPKGLYERSCRRHTRDAEKTAIVLLNRLRDQLFLGQHDLPKSVRRAKFDEMARLWYQRHYEEYKDPVTLKPRSQAAKDGVRYTVEQLCEFFGQMDFDGVEPTDIKNYRDKLIEYDDKQPGTFNKHKGILSSMFSMVERWVELKEIEPVKVPKKNPTQFIQDLQESPRSRVASLEELGRLKEACFALHDPALWDIIKLELNTTLRLGDLKRAHQAKEVDGVMTLNQGKTGFDVNLPAIQGTKRGQIFVNFRGRWERARIKAVLGDLQFRDLRRTGAHLLKKLNVTKELIKDTLGHRKSSTTETYLNFKDVEHIKPAIEARAKLVDSI